MNKICAFTSQRASEQKKASIRRTDGQRMYRCASLQWNNFFIVLIFQTFVVFSSVLLLVQSAPQQVETQFRWVTETEEKEGGKEKGNKKDR